MHESNNPQNNKSANNADRSQLPQNQQKQQTWEERVVQLSYQIVNDCSLKKGIKAKFIKHAEQVGKVWNSKPQEPNYNQLMLLAGLYKNLGKLGQHEQFLEKALVLLKEAQGMSCLVMRWTLQLIAFKSSAKKYIQQDQTRVMLFNCFEDFGYGAITPLENVSLKHAVRLVLGISNEQTKDEVIWLFNDRNMAQEMLFRLRKGSPQKLALPFYHDYEFHIADVMTLQGCRQGWQQKYSNNLRDLIVYISICCFTLATEKYYLKDYTQKCNHIKALKIALSAFEINCTYVAFLAKILQQHFGKNMHPIVEEHQVRADQHQLMYYLPKERKEVPLLQINFADQ